MGGIEGIVSRAVRSRFGGMTSEAYLEPFLRDRTITRGQWYRAWRTYRSLSRYC